MTENRITNLFKIKYPIIQAGMVWVSGWKLASAVSNCGGLGLIGAGSMKKELLKEHLIKCRNNTDKPFGVNLPQLREDAEELLDVCINEGVQIIFTSAGNPAKFIDKIKKNNITAVHVVPGVKYGKKAESLGYDAVVGEGVEAGGHNGADQLTTFCLIPQLSDAMSIPVVAAGGIADLRGINAALELGADAVQIGSRFAATIESSAHEIYKNILVQASENDTVLAFKKLALVRMYKNKYAMKVIQAEAEGATIEQLKDLLGSKREKMGIFEGNLEEGMLEMGQGVGLIKEIPTVKELFVRWGFN